MIDRRTACGRFLRWEQRTDLLPLSIGEPGQTKQRKGLCRLCWSQGCLRGVTLLMTTSGSGLMKPSKTRPAQSFRPSFLRCSQDLDDPTQFGDTPQEAFLLGSTFFSLRW